MNKQTTISLELDHQFDPRTCRHTLNGQPHVLHCHHYASLYSQLADDCGFVDAKQMLADSSEDSFYGFFQQYFRDKGVKDTTERFAISEQYYSQTGLGKMNVVEADDKGGVVELEHSHVDEGWVKKWGKRDKPVNFITRGYISAAFSAAYGRPARSYSVVEEQSIVSGADRSRFRVESK